MLIPAIISITLALVFYTIGVWGEKLSGGLKVWNLSMFWAGLVFDTVGTAAMSAVAGAISLNLHALTGLIAIILMIFHALWATIVIIKKNEKMKKTFHRFSIIVWIIWLIPYISGAMLNMQ